MALLLIRLIQARWASEETNGRILIVSAYRCVLPSDSVAPYVVAFRSLDSWSAGFKRCEVLIKEQCEEGARIGCAVSASKNCQPPWWRNLADRGSGDMREREKCVTRDFEECLAAAKDKCAGFAKEICSKAFLDARVAIAGSSSLLNLRFFVSFIVLFLAIKCGGESSTCLTVYKEGGAPAVFQSPKCPRWNLQNWGSRSGGGRCQTAAIQGRRKYQEDRVLCALDLLIPFPGKAGTKDVLVGIAAVFDGHNGAEASEMASKLLLDYFALHINFLLDATFSAVTRKLIGRLPTQGEHGVILHGVSQDDIMHLYKNFKMQFRDSLPLNVDDSFHLDIMKEALLRAIHDIDATFSKEATNRKLNSGSTATVALIADGQLMVASIGDSKALLCSEKFETPEEARATLVNMYKEHRRNRGSSPSRFSDFKPEHSNGLVRLIAKELTKDHHPNREDEKIRVEAAGGYVTEWAGVPRVNGQLAVSRSIGDLTYKSYGVISAPEVMDWQPLMANDSYLVVSSDGIFEKLEVQDVCDRLWEVNNQTSSQVPSYCAISLADCLVNTAFEKGSMDNIAAVVVPLKSNLVSHLQRKEQCMSDNQDEIASALPSHTCALPLSHDTNSGLLQLKQAQPLAPMFNRLLVEVKNGSFRCFYMSENLIGTSLVQMDALDGSIGELPQVLPATDEPFSGASENLSDDKGWCLLSGTTVNENQDQCINPDSFAIFLGLLESVPLHDFGANNGTDSFPDSSYVLKKKFGRGAFGEVWLAFHWNCYQGNTSKSGVHINRDTDNLTSNTSTDHSTDQNDADGPDNSFILKRIMVERGPTVYLSGLREKHFGELFLNAYNISGNSSGTQTSSPQSTSSAKLDLSEEGLKHIARYIEYFESRYNDIWLVFHHEGVSLSKLMYTVEEAEDGEKAEEASHAQILRPSKWWTWLKTTESGNEEMRRIVWQLLLGLKACHDRNITHRDIKPENMVICLEDIKSGKCLKGVPNGHHNYKTKMRIIDFGSALDEFTMKHLYGSTGPSRAEQTHDYAPPEAILNSIWYRGPTSLTLKYDMWSVGVVMLEMILGSPNVFDISHVTRALLDKHIRGWSENFKELAYKLRSFMELCILLPGSSLKHGGPSSKQGGISLASWKCSEEFFAEQIKSRDPLKIGFPNVWALRLVRGLLQWYPEDRMTVDEALKHPYFQPPPSS